MPSTPPARSSFATERRSTWRSTSSSVIVVPQGFADPSGQIGITLPANTPFGIDVVTGLCERLVAGGAPGIHFYTLNQSALSLEICRRLGAVPG